MRTRTGEVSLTPTGLLRGQPGLRNAESSSGRLYRPQPQGQLHLAGRSQLRHSTQHEGIECAESAAVHLLQAADPRCGLQLPGGALTPPHPSFQSLAATPWQKYFLADCMAAAVSTAVASGFSARLQGGTGSWALHSSPSCHRRWCVVWFCDTHGPTVCHLRRLVRGLSCIPYIPCCTWDCTVAGVRCVQLERVQPDRI